MISKQDILDRYSANLDIGTFHFYTSIFFKENWPTKNHS